MRNWERAGLRESFFPSGQKVEAEECFSPGRPKVGVVEGVFPGRRGEVGRSPEQMEDRIDDAGSENETGDDLGNGENVSVHTESTLNNPIAVPVPVRPPTKTSTGLPHPLLHALRLLIRANHILHHHGLASASTHISIRHPLAPDQYILAAPSTGTPAQLKSRSDFTAYRISDSSPVDADAPPGPSERFLHAEIMKRFPRAKCVVQAYSDIVVPFSIARCPVRPVMHMAGFLGAAPLPVFRVPPSIDQGADLLIRTPRLARALAAELSMEQPVVLQHQRGFTTFGVSVQQAVYRAVYTQMNCRLLAQALVFAGGDAEKVEYLEAEQVEACARMNRKCQDRAWGLWVREVQGLPLYVNEEGEPEGGAVGRLKV